MFTNFSFEKTILHKLAYILPPSSPLPLPPPLKSVQKSPNLSKHLHSQTVRVRMLPNPPPTANSYAPLQKCARGTIFTLPVLVWCNLHEWTACFSFF